MHTNHNYRTPRQDNLQSPDVCRKQKTGFTEKRPTAHVVYVKHDEWGKVGKKRFMTKCPKL